MRHVLAAVLLVASVLATPPVFAEDEDLATAVRYLKGIEVPKAWSVELFDCHGKWNTDFCKLEWAARNRLYKKDYVGAIKMASAALRLKPRSRSALATVGRALFRLDGCTTAFAYLEAAAHVEHNAIDDYILCLPAVSADRVDHERALRLTELMAHKTGHYWYWYAASLRHLRAGRHEAARNRARRVVEEADGSQVEVARPWQSFAQLLVAFDEVEEAIEALQRSIELSTKDDKPTLEARYLLLAGLLLDAERYEDARRHATALLRASDERIRTGAASLVVQVEDWQHGPARALEMYAELGVDDEMLQRKLALAAAMTADNVHYELDEALPLTEKVKWLIAVGETADAIELVAAELREPQYGANAEYLLAELDFRNRECSDLGRARYGRLSTRSDYADLWHDAMFSAGWRMVCGRSPLVGFRPRRTAPPDLQAHARAMHEAAVLLVSGDYDDAYRAAAQLPADGPPVFHVFGMWIAAGMSDASSFHRHAAAAARGGFDPDEHLAYVFFHLRRGDLPAAQSAWRALPPTVRDAPIVINTSRALLAYLVVVEAFAHDADFATQMARKWFWAQGPLEAWVWKRLEQTGTQIAER